MAPFCKKGAVFSLIITFRKKMVSLEERKPFSKSAPQGSTFQKTVGNGTLPLKVAPFWLPWGAFFSTKKGWKRLPWGTKIVPPCKREPFSNFFWKIAPFSLKGHYLSAPVALFLYRKCMGKTVPFWKVAPKQSP